MGTAYVVGVAGVTLLALALRWVGLKEGLFGDELYLYEIARRASLGSMLSAVHDTESTPPFHFLLAWASVKLGDPTVTVRLPSLVLGTATIPLTYLLGLRTVGRRPALIAAALLAISPFAIWYGDEARAYATMTFLAVASALALVLALQTQRRRWWAVYALSACLILYTHYMGVFVVVAQGAWAFWTQRERWRELVVAHAAIVGGYLPWLPSFVFQSHDTSANRISTFKPFTPKGVVRELTISVDGHPFEPLTSVPGRAALVLLALGVAAALGGGVLRWRRRRAGDRSGLETGASAGHVHALAGLVVVLALATPAGVALYSLVAQNAYIPRNLSASLAAICLTLGAGVAQLRRPWAGLATAGLVVALGIGAARVVNPDHGRPPYRQAAAFVDDRDRGPAPGIVIEYPLFPAFAYSDVPLARHLQVHFLRRHVVHQVRSPASPGWDDVPRYRKLFVVTPWDAAHRAGGPPLPPRFARRFRLVDSADWRGIVPVAVFEYTTRRD